MKNNKGYMLVEIIIAAVITMTIAYMLLDLTYNFKTKNEDTFNETIFLTEKTLMTKEVMNDVNNYKVMGVDFSCNNNTTPCFVIKYSDGTNEINKKLIINKTDHKYLYGKIDASNDFINGQYYEKKITDKLVVGEITITNHCYGEKGESINGIDTCEAITGEKYEINALLEINIPLSNQYLKENFSVKISVPYSTIEVDNDPSLIIDYPYKNEGQLFKAEKTGTYKIELWGSGDVKEINKHDGGSYVKGEIYLNKGQEMFVYVGTTNNQFNGGGGALGTSPGGPTYGNGATDVRITDGNWNNTNSLISRIIVAGASGKNYDKANGDASGICKFIVPGVASAGGLSAPNSVSHANCSSSNYNEVAATGGTQTSGGNRSTTPFGSTSVGTNGSFGIGGSGGPCVNSYWTCAKNNSANGSGGGGGYYGGGGCWGPYPGQDSCSGSGGGSSFISGHTGCVTVTSVTSSTPKSGCTTGTTDNSCSLHPNGYVFSNTKMIDGAGYLWTNTKGNKEQMPNPLGGYYDLGIGHSGSGYARISYISADPPEEPETYNYGDGSLNIVSRGYDTTLKVNGKTPYTTTAGYLTGNFGGLGQKATAPSPATPYNWLLPEYIFLNGTAHFTPQNTNKNKALIYAGTNNYTFIPITGEKTVGMYVGGGGLTTSLSISGFKLNINGNYYTLKQCVDNGYIKPIVIFGSQSQSTSYTWVFDLSSFYNGGATDIRNYSTMRIIFMTNEGYSINGFQVYANKAFDTTYDGYWVYAMDINDLRLTIE